MEGLGSGDQIDLNVLGMQIEGLARVVSVESCPTIDSGPGEVITGTYTGYSFNVRRLWIDGLLEPIEATGDHPIYSEDRMCFVSVSAIQHGQPPANTVRNGDCSIDPTNAWEMASL